jgi:MFS transporter, DHA2 family, multidrug resistance protein
MGVGLLGQRPDHSCGLSCRLCAAAKSQDPHPEALNPLAAVLSIVGLGSLVYAIISTPGRGWLSARSLVGFGVGVVLIGGFLVWELRATTPMLNLQYFLDPRFGVAAGVITLIFFAMFGFFFLMTQYFQLVLGHGTLEAGLKQLPFAAVMMAIAPNSPRFAARIGTNRTVSIGLIGLIGIAVSMFLFAFAGAHTSYLAVLPVVMIMAAGMAICIPSMNGSIMSAVPLRQSSRRFGDERHHQRTRRCARRGRTR